MENGGGGFRTTRWSVILRAGERWTAEAQDALSTLCAVYRDPCVAFVRSKVGDTGQAEDVVQGFFARLLEKNDLPTLDPRRGRFRNWLRAALSHHLANARDHDQRRAPPAPADAAEPFHELTPEKVMDGRWRLTVVRRAVAALRAEEERKGHGPLFQALVGTLLRDGDGLLHRQIAEKFGMTANAIKQRAYRLRGRLQDLVRAEVADTLEHPGEDEIDAEIRHLLGSWT
jgi:RNA polymerase sigma-70 factor (ECF subfamily)